MDLFDTRITDHPQVRVNKDLTIEKPGILNTLFKGPGLDNAVLFETLKASVTKRVTPENRNVFTDNMESLDNRGELTSGQATILKVMAAKEKQTGIANDR